MAASESTNLIHRSFEYKTCPLLEATTAVHEQWVTAARQSGSMAAAPRKLSQAAQGGQPSAHSRNPKDKGDVWGWWVAEKTDITQQSHDCAFLL